MTESFCTPSIAITIGRSSRLLHLYITEAAAALDAPSTITLHAAPFADLTGFAADQVDLGVRAAQAQSRLILVDSLHLEWQRARCRENGSHLIAADSLLLGAATLERWLWQRLQQASFPCSGTNTKVDDNTEGGQSLCGSVMLALDSPVSPRR
jgi:hypothetical protein